MGRLTRTVAAVHFPVEMHIAAHKIPAFSRKGVLLRLLSLFTLSISIAAAIGSVAYIITDVQVNIPLPRTAWLLMKLVSTALRCSPRLTP